MDERSYREGAMKFPLFETIENKLVSLTGETSYLWRLTPPDLEQVEDKSSYYSSIEESIILNKTEWAKFYYIDGQHWFNSKEELKNPNISSEVELNPLSILFKEANSEIELFDNYFVLNNRFYQLLSVETFMDQISITDLENCNFCLMFEKIKANTAKNKLQLNRRMHFSSTLKNIRDIESEKSYQESEDLLENVITGETEVYRSEMFFIVDGVTKKDLDDKSKELIEYINSLSGKLRIEGRGLSFFLNSIIPGVRPSLKRHKLMPSTYMSELIPLSCEEVASKGMKLSSRKGKPVAFNLFDNKATNYNILITGTSGQGKSMIANKLIKEELESGSKGIILDLGNSFKKNTLFHKGAVFSEKFNPFQFKNPVYLKEFIISVTGYVWDRKEAGKLYESIKENIDKADTFNELIALLDNEIGDIKYYFSEIEKFFTDEDIKLNDLTYCDLTIYPEIIKSPLMVYLVEYFKQLEGKKIFVFDECWGLLKNNADYIAECFRTFRKHNASAIAISQNLDDFSETQLGRVIIQNTYYKFLFKQNIGKTPFVSDFQLDLLDTVKSNRGEYSEFLTLSEEMQKIVRYYSSALEYELFTSSKRDNDQIEKYFEEKGKYLDFDMAFRNYTKIKYPHFMEEL
jgi:type IV secretory pathway VirB4 component